MRIKNLLTAFTTFCILLVCSNTKAATPVLPINNDSVQIVSMKKRVSDIQNMDIRNMSSSQKHSLKVELKAMLKQAKTYNTSASYEGHGGGGVYLSVGALILIIILLIILL